MLILRPGNQLSFLSLIHLLPWGILSNIINNNYSSSSEIIAIDFYSKVFSDVE